jgi:hypothetical protein
LEQSFEEGFLPYTSLVEVLIVVAFEDAQDIDTFPSNEHV